jgi:hypothetical protein
MGNTFDNLRNAAYDVVSKTMGYAASWIPSDDSGEKTARVLYKDPEAMKKLGSVEYNPKNYAMEYRAPDFTGLKESVDSGVTENVTIEGKGDYYVRAVSTLWDGNTYLAILELKI